MTMSPVLIVQSYNRAGDIEVTAQGCYELIISSQRDAICLRKRATAPPREALWAIFPFNLWEGMIHILVPDV